MRGQSKVQHYAVNYRVSVRLRYSYPRESNTLLLLTSTLLVHSELPEEERELKREVFDQFAQRASAGVTGFGVIQQKDWFAGRARGLETRGHLARLEWRDSRVLIASREEHCRIFFAGLDLLIRRVGVEIFELRGIGGIPVLE